MKTMIIDYKKLPRDTEMVRLRLYRDGDFIINHGAERIGYLRPPSEEDELESMAFVSTTTMIRDRESVFKRLYKGQPFKLLYFGKVIGVFLPEVPDDVLRSKNIETYENVK